MKKNNKSNKSVEKKQGNVLLTVILLIFLAISAAFGYLCGINGIDLFAGFDGPYFLLLPPTVYLVYKANICIHEGGHLVFGLLTGYRFQSFRVGGLMIAKCKGKLSVKRHRVLGTGGQCLMIPPEVQPENAPFALYHLGGVIFNFIVFALSVSLYFFTSGAFRTILMILAIYNGVTFITNGIPFGSLIMNDGRNVLTLKKDAGARKAFYYELKIHAACASGLTLSEMPDEWFSIPTDDELGSYMTAAKGIYAYNRFIEQGRIAEAREQIARLLAPNTSLIGLHKVIVKCDLIYFELVDECRPDVIEREYDETQQRMMNAMKNEIMILRTKYALALLYDKNETAADQILKTFEKYAKRHPYAPDVSSERMLVSKAKEKHEERKTAVRSAVTENTSEIQ